MLPPAILFDLDDTILAWDAAADPTWRRLCDVYAGRASGVEAAALFAGLREVRDWFWSDSERHRTGRLDLAAARRAIVERTFARVGIADSRMALEMADAYTAERETGIQPFPGAIETLGELSTRGVRLALLTNGAADAQRRKVRRFGLERFFQSILIEGEQGFGKPNPAVYRKALADLRVEARDAWIVGDHLEWDVSAPQALGIHAIWHDFKGRGLPAGSPVRPDRIVSSIAELLT